MHYGGKPGYVWTGTIVEETPSRVVVEATFTYPSRDLGYVYLEQGDRWVESYFFDRWYNIFEIYGRDGQLKGWYCNVTTPARLEDGELSFTDLALDLFVYPDGRYLVLDEEEYAKARSEVYRPEEVREADRAVQELTTLARQQRLPRHGVTP
jgi:predicted RNA-binding protein associated with RNAse of E/G family